MDESTSTSRSYNFKVVLLGEGCVGKTSLVLRYVEDKFNDKHITTLQVKNWVKELKKILGSDICLTIAGNKIDLEKQRNVSSEEAERYAESVGASHFQTSAKMNRGIEEMFLELSHRMVDRAREAEQQKLASGNASNVMVVEDDAVTSESSGSSRCCGSGASS
ncbi:hypothetical protein J437_LFUL001870 [Ladona fulva]|uniref:Uncharacterized protein n=1 Tax=Ladona fulva TaxID=123851 RepID=A0A8K0JY09_LADFU|nr:hypothetical protein J437_LFUL001870 [Ladona fulva]